MRPQEGASLDLVRTTVRHPGTAATRLLTCGHVASHVVMRCITLIRKSQHTSVLAHLCVLATTSTPMGPHMHESYETRAHAGRWPAHGGRATASAVVPARARESRATALSHFAAAVTALPLGGEGGTGGHVESVTRPMAAGQTAVAVLGPLCVRPVAGPMHARARGHAHPCRSAIRCAVLVPHARLCVACEPLYGPPEPLPSRQAPRVPAGSAGPSRVQVDASTPPLGLTRHSPCAQARP
jgi:hypothetical protein